MNVRPVCEMQSFKFLGKYMGEYIYEIGLGQNS